MWISREAYRQWITSVKQVEVDRDRVAIENKELRARIDELQTLLVTARVATSKAEQAAAVARAYTDTWRLRVNELAMERQALFNKLVGLDIPVAKVENEPVSYASGTMFDDVGDLAAKHMGIPEHPIDAILGSTLGDTHEA